MINPNHEKTLPLFRNLLYLTILLSIFYLLAMSGCGKTDPEASCDLDLPSPVLAFSGTENYTVGEVEHTRYRLEVTNRDDFPDGLFEPSPDLPACGANTNSARTWVTIYDNQDNRLYGFCALGSSDDLDSLWFSLPKGQTPPATVYVVLEDRKCEKTYTSNQIHPGPECYADLPDPQLVYTGKEDYTANDAERTRYRFNVTNKTSFPDALFAPAPNLAPCGQNANAARTWVTLYDSSNNRLYGFCALESSDDLANIWFSLPKGQTPPQYVYITLEDRECEKTYTSNQVHPGPECYADLPDPQLVFTGKEDYTLNDVERTRYRFNVTNKASFPNALFAPAPDLEPCGANTNSARTWVNIYDNSNNRLYGFCALESSNDLNSIWFSLPKGQAPPQYVYITLEDRECEKTYTSNQVHPGPECYADLPDPQLVFTGKEDYTLNDVERTRYRFNVTNKASFPNALFAPAPDLEPCGANTNSARTWVNIYDNSNSYLYGFCALGSSNDLDSIWFSLPKGQAPPASVHIVLNDRECGMELTSNSVSVETNSPFLGNWTNENLETDFITRLTISLNGLNLDVQEWGACTPVDCDWGVESTPVTDAVDNILSLFWEPGFVERTQSIELVTAGRLKVTTQSHFLDGRPDFTRIEYFMK